MDTSRNELEHVLLFIFLDFSVACIPVILFPYWICFICKKTFENSLRNQSLAENLTK